MQLNDILQRNQTKQIYDSKQPEDDDPLVFIKTRDGVKIDFEMGQQQD